MLTNKKYSKKLIEKFGKGYDYTNLSRMKTLYLTFQKVGAPSQQLTWTHYKYILPIKNESKRNYYDTEIKEDFHNTTIGIVICKKNDKDITKYTNPNILVTSYELVK